MSNYPNICKLSSLHNYTHPVLHIGKVWFIDFKAFDPISGTLKRKKYNVPKAKNKRERLRDAQETVLFLESLLKEGWTPFGNNQTQKSLIMEFSHCLDLYAEQVNRLYRKKTRQSYLSRINMLKQFNALQEKPIRLVFQFDTVFCMQFLDWIFMDRDNSARTRNNYRNWLFTFSEFMVMHGMLSENPVARIGHLKEEVKYRKEITEPMLERMGRYLRKRDRYFYLACMMAYYTLARPNELSFIKIGDIRLFRQAVFIPAEVSKNAKDGEVSINEEIIKLMLDLDVLTKPSDYYLFSHDCMPGKEHVGADQFNKRWKEMRAILGWSNRYQFYSLKDSGIRDLANAEGITVARDQARHADISTTNKYVQQHMAPEASKHFKGSLKTDEV